MLLDTAQACSTLPFWNGVWPKLRDLASPQIAESVARGALAAGSEFPAALKAVYDWLRPVEHLDFLIHRMGKSEFCSRFPADALNLLHSLISEQRWIPSEFARCLDKIAQVAPALAPDIRYIRLRDLARQ